MRPTVAVIGAGLSGLSVAYELRERAERLPGGLDVICLDAARRPGGTVRTHAERGFVCDAGPLGFLPGEPAAETLLRRLGLQSAISPALPAASRGFVFRNGRLRPVPRSTVPWVRGDLLGGPSKLRALCEPFVAAGADGLDETVAGFLERRFGRTSGRLLADALATWCCAGDPDKLSMAATCPELPALERRHGSLLRPLFGGLDAAPTGRHADADVGDGAGDAEGEDEKNAEARRAPTGPWTLRRRVALTGGTQRLVDALARAVEPDLQLGCRVEAVADMGQRGFRILLDSGPPVDVDAAVIACPAWDAAELVRTMDPGMAHALSSVPSVPLVRVHTGFRAEAIGTRASGAGFLAPRGEGLRILGSLWTSQIFPGRAPERSALLTTFLGGARDPEAVELPERALLDVVARDLKVAMGIVSDPWFVHVDRNPRAIPQPAAGHPRRMHALAERLDQHPGLWLAGSDYRERAFPRLAAEAARIAEEVLGRVGGMPLAAAR